LKGLAQEIKYQKTQRKPSTRTNGLTTYKICDIIDRKKHEYRHWHIAYCVLKSTPRERIEIPRDNNKPDETYISKIQEEITRQYAEEQTVCNSPD
jgi:hypothetical protein